MAVGDTFVETSNSLASAGDFIVAGSDGTTGAAEVGEIGGSGGAEVYRQADPDGDGSFEVEVMIDTFTGEWHSQQNGLVVSSNHRTRLRIRNTSGGAADYYAIGMEVQD